MAGLVIRVIVSYPFACLIISVIAFAPVSTLSNHRPVHLAILTLLFSIIIFSVFGRAFPAYEHDNTHNLPTSASLQQSRKDEGKHLALDAPSPRSWGRSFVILIASSAIALAIRIDLQRRILLKSECASTSIEVWLPFLVAILDALCFQQVHRSSQQHTDIIDASIYDDAIIFLKSKWLSNSWRYVPAAFLLSLGGHLLGGLWSSTESSHVCPLVSSDITRIPQLQWAALVVDIFILTAFFELGRGKKENLKSASNLPIVGTAISTLAMCIWLVIALVVIVQQPENRTWLFLSEESQFWRTVFMMLCQAFMLATACIALLHNVNLNGTVHVCMTTSAITAVVAGSRFLWTEYRPYPPVSSMNLTLSFVLVYFAWTIHTRVRCAVITAESPPSPIRRLLTFLAFIVIIYPGLTKTNTVHYHPIDLLMYDAQSKYIDYVNRAARSKTLKEAVHNYHELHSDTPPPGFDLWFEFAQTRSVVVMDDFNQIHNDLLPFRALKPAELRQKTWDMVSNPWNEISGISIRDGIAKVQENVLPTHRWMLEGVVEMVKTFSEHLPDMDLAFNLNDEPRVALQYGKFEAVISNSVDMVFQGTSTYQRDRALDWKDTTMESIDSTVFENWSFSNSYYEWAALTCPSDSAARKMRAPLFKSQLCLHCAATHSLGQFIANWSIAADPCHQPDLANLHGFYLSPAAFKPTHMLMPVFSQSKVQGFNDILYPSAWNYIDKVAYTPSEQSSADRAAYPDPPFREKNSTLYWRGATSEGVSTGVGSWRGMARQRMVHMANNLTNSPHDRVSLLVPEPRHPQRLTYVDIEGASLPRLGLHTDARFVNEIVRCGGKDCEEQAAEFGLVQPADFQAHWQYKYLVDLDGAGFSGRFLPFLQSRSLPFKAALFREWYDSRLIPWLHFVPIDLRLHGLWSTIAYFTGINGASDGKVWNWAGHEREAEMIAESGREWSRKVIRKEDMEVYFFRLLLEWARLTDDRRDELGFAI